MASKKMKIDGKKLYSELKKVGKNGKTISLELGYTGDYIANAVYRGELRMGAVRFLEAVYNIKPEAYKKTKEQKATEKPAEEKPAVFSTDQLVEEMKVLNGTTELTGRAVDELLVVLNDIRIDLATIRAYMLAEATNKWAKPEGSTSKLKWEPGKGVTKEK